MLVELALIDSEGVTFGVTVTVMLFEVMVEEDPQELVPVTSQVMISPFANVDDEKEVASVPTFEPFTFHW
jgi:hypothetical protein